MSENNYQLVAWTENGEIKFSGYAMWEQEMLLQDEIDSIDTDSMDWDSYSRLTHLYWEWGMLLIGMKENWDAYGRFKDGLYVCMEAIRFIHFPKDGGINPFLLAMDDLIEGCHSAALNDLEQGGTLEEVFHEEAFHDIRRQLWRGISQG